MITLSILNKFINQSILRKPIENHENYQNFKNMQSDDILRNKITEIAHFKLERLDQDEINELMAANGSFIVMGMPGLVKVVKMSKKKLLTLLRLCPLSDFFGQRQINMTALSRNNAQAHALQMFKEKTKMQDEDIIEECSPSQES